MQERTGTKSKGGGGGRCRQLYRTQYEFHLSKHSIPYIVSLIPKSQFIEPTKVTYRQSRC